MKTLTLDRFTSLVRTGSVRQVHLKQHPETDGGGWYLHVDHADYDLTCRLFTQRGGVRLFKTADAAIKTLDECGYVGHLVIIGKTADESR